MLRNPAVKAALLAVLLAVPPASGIPHPYVGAPFVVNVCDPAAEATIFNVNAGTSEPGLIAMTLWTAYGTPVVSISADWLVLSFNLREIFVPSGFAGVFNDGGAAFVCPAENAGPIEPLRISTAFLLQSFAVDTSAAPNSRKCLAEGFATFHPVSDCPQGALPGEIAFNMHISAKSIWGQSFQVRFDEDFASGQLMGPNGHGHYYSGYYHYISWMVGGLFERQSIRIFAPSASQEARAIFHLVLGQEELGPTIVPISIPIDSVTSIELCVTRYGEECLVYPGFGIIAIQCLEGDQLLPCHVDTRYHVGGRFSAGLPAAVLANPVSPPS